MPRKRLVAACALACTAALASNARAGDVPATDDPGKDRAVVLDTVTITAEKRETALRDTPLAVSAISPDAIQRKGTTTLRELTGDVPGLSAPGSITNMQSLYIRGIGTADPGFYPAVAVYVDDVYLPRPFGVGTFILPDLERIEVLRGPQGTLYGQNSSAGAVRFISRDPDDTPAADVALGVGNDGYREGSVYLSTPIKPQVLSVGLAVASERTDGYTYNANLDKEVDAVDLQQARLKFKLTPAEGTSATLSLDYTRDRSDNALYIPVGYPGANPRTTFADVDTQLGRIDKGVTLHVDQDLGEHLSFKSISGYRKFDDNPSPWDQDGTPNPANEWVQYIDQNQFSQEFQLNGDYDRFDFTTGAVYFREQLAFDRLTGLNGNFSELLSHLHSESEAIYGQAEWKATDALGFVAGGRFSRDRQEFANDSFRDTPDGTRTSQVYSVAGLEHEWNAFTPKIGVNYRWPNGVLNYFTVTRGDKLGGYNRAASTAQIADLPVGPEKVTAYELGSKQTHLDGRAETSVALFYNDFRDYQAQVTNPTVNGDYITGSVLVNAAKARTYGAEFEGTIRFSEDWDLKGSAAWLKTKFTDFQNPTGALNSDYTGNELPNAPEWTLGLSSNYRLPLSLPGETSIDAYARYIDAQFSDIGNTENTRVGAQTYVGAGIDYRTADNRWDISLKANNLLNKTYAVNLKYQAGVSNQAAYSPPRQIVFGVRYTY